MVMIYPHTIRYGQSNQPGEYDVAHDPTYIYTHNMYIYIYICVCSGGMLDWINTCSAEGLVENVRDYVSQLTCIPGNWCFLAPLG